MRWMESLARQTLGVHVSCKLPHLVVCPLSTGLVGFDVFQQRFYGSRDNPGVFFGPLHGVCLDIGRRLARCELTLTVCVSIQIEDSQGATDFPFINETRKGMQTKTVMSTVQMCIPCPTLSVRTQRWSSSGHQQPCPRTLQAAKEVLGCTRDVVRCRAFSHTGALSNFGVE